MTAQRYNQKRRAAASRSRSMSRDGRDIGSIPPVAEPGRRAAAEKSFRVFCETYHSETFALEWSDDHLEVLEVVERVVVKGDTVTVAMPRGSGKTSICMAAVEWAALLGLHRFIVLIGPTADHARKLLAGIKAHLESNDLLLADFPEVCYPIRQLDGEARRCAGQTHFGERTRITWGERELVLPDVHGSQSAGVCIRVQGITGSIRGMQHNLPNGQTIRPTLGLLDDVQTKSSAHSPSQTQSRLETINGDITGLAGPGERMALLAPLTVIAEGDAADQLLDRDKYPEWQGQRKKLVYAWPEGQEAEDHWAQYFTLRDESFRNGGRGELATAYYARNRAAMDADSVVGWTARFDEEDGELSALQHAMNLRHKDAAAFAAEYQNEPVVSQTGGGGQAPDGKALLAKATATPRGTVPEGCERLTAFVDVQQGVLWWMVCGWRSGLGGHVVAAGCWPEQGRRYFTKRDAKKTYGRAMPGAGFDAQLYHALGECCGDVLDAIWPREDGAELRVERLLIDAGWGKSTDLVNRFCRESRHAAVVMPSKGLGLKARDIPLPDRKKKEGTTVGHHWQVQRPQRRALRHVVYDANRWKTLLHARLAAPLGAPDTITLHAGSPTEHKMLVDHLTAERATQTEAQGRTLETWDAIPNRDNDWLDCLVGCGVAASLLGVSAGMQQGAAAPKKRRLLRRPKAQAKF